MGGRYKDAVILVHSPLALGGLLMIVGAQLLRRTRSAGRIVATVGAAIVLGVGAFLSVLWMGLDQRAIGIAGLAYALFHGALIVLVWRGRFDAEARAGFTST